MAVKGLKHATTQSARVGIIKGDGVICHHRQRPIKAEAQVGLQLGARQQRTVKHIPHAYGAGVDHTCRVLAHLYHTAAIRLGGHQVQRRQLGDGVAYAVVDGALRYLAAGDVHYRHSHHGRSRRHGEHLIPIAQHHDSIGTQTAQRLSGARHTLRHSLHARGLVIAGGIHGHPRIHGKSGIGNLADSHAVGLQQVHIGGHNLQATPIS